MKFAYTLAFASHALGAEPLKPPATLPWGQTLAWVRGRDGTLVELCTPVGG
ncbi:hypothetical protein [Derxia gummosa]|uniref:Uncharacterized protein n=1 Tax=Derxia gummosa DSM 723 TaxID=1121388 RepID=A0A8B6XCZ8_9BURK|nr:hypothetical protein [Derxia gummosa]